MIKSLEAFCQKLNFEQVFPFCSVCSDIDYIFRLINGIILIVEIKKDTESHKAENFLKTEQYKLMRDLIGTREDVYFVYATHNNPISKDILIDASDCTVKFVRHNCDDTFIDSGISLTKFTKDLCYNEYIKSEYYVMVKYPNGKMQYCIVAPESKKWVTEYYNKDLHCFNDIRVVDTYIHDRFLCEYNYNNEYWVFRKDGDSIILLDIRKRKTFDLTDL